ncbi:actin cytoskeleton-regulatory complex protein PAN1 isoform X1 [Cyclopterus lumpus]|uniref:actin cytoskeleton-regulatory complex protein PAN1 isoform X1 n=1 Tax=Cyclopterus lumpus TaxID=8103 RepID=UPI001485E5A1|nr:actin cytoskeleton-regulatory complex protein PAN1 isoform X1 [Cyclopterus lumpus]
MEAKLQQEKQESEHKHSNEDQGGIRHRLRDRNLLRKRKVEAEEKETNQWVSGVESQRKKHRAESSTKRRGKPKKSEPMPEISIIQEEAAVSQEVPVLVVPEPTEVIPDQTPGSLFPLLAVESQPSPVPAAAAPRPLFESIQSSIFAPTLTSPAPVKPTTALFSPSTPVPFPVKVLDTAPVLVLDSPPAPDAVLVTVPVLTQALVPTAAPAPAAAPLQVETIFTEAQCREALDQVLIKDLGPEEEGDISSSQDKRANEDLIGTSSYNIPDQNKMLPTLSLTPPPQKYFPGNLF